jgi:hypothetical protein
MKRLAFAWICSALLGCSASPGGDRFESEPSEDPPLPPSAEVAAPLCADVGKAYVGFANTPLSRGRAAGTAGADRGRIKPYSALSREYTRTLGAVPASLQGASTTFSASPPRWYVEPEASAIAVITQHAVAFEGCLAFTKTAADFAAGPTEESSRSQCAGMMRKFWMQTGTPDEVDSCVRFATVDTAAVKDARRRWAHVCASIMSSAGFMAY